ncbi:hypothetical protein [Rhodopseudomonas pseudopalustris]|uniref:Uncharacterized protein n=1 Tax=Rhodopseudomonas pseudopalustris TaxID=1513892 RepID=A0A1H8WIN3_9BRAD|nr:hypothetical protein [Rhodopseudomonas pseudopalustris]SEP27506.1 hypothetical protein SAMN05444123_112130 [Rhodopseudomonas pseudopalustris]
MAKKGGGDNSAQIAAQARQDEQARQAKIRDGTARINSMFDGTPYAPIAAPAPQMSIGDAKAFVATGGAAGGPTPAAPAAPFDNGGFGGFTDDFYNGRRDAYLKYALPQLDQQAGEARKQLTFSLARSNLLDSSTRAEKEAEFQRTFDAARQGVHDNANAAANETRSNVESARADLIKMLTASGDTEGAVNSALSRAQSLSQPTPFSPLSSVFANFTSALGAQAAAERAQAYSGGVVKAPFNTGLFGSGSSVKVS